MAELQNFRSAFNGFNREDVVHYIAYINNKHNAELNQLQTQLTTALEEIEQLKSIPAVDPAVVTELEESRALCASLEEELAQVQAELAAAREELNKPQTDEELEAYRRAERVERIANQRVNALYEQANGALADATLKVDEASETVTQMVDAVSAQLNELQVAMAAGRNTLRDAAATMYAVRPVDHKE